MEQRLYDLTEQLTLVLKTKHTDKLPEAVKRTMYARFFVYNLNKGGFAQFLFNAAGRYLPETETLLLDAKATVTHGFYVKAITLCTSNVPLYNAFLESDYISENELKNELHILSLEYFQSGTSFLEEAKVFMEETLTEAEQWLTFPA
jgi:hypothetical protein